MSPVALLVRIEASIREAVRLHLYDVAEPLMDAKQSLLRRVRRPRKVKVAKATREGVLPGSGTR